MSESLPPQSHRSVDRVVEEARRHFVPDTHGEGHDWSAADAALFARIRNEARGRTPERRPVLAIATGVALAAAAAATLFFRPAPAPVREGAPVLATTAMSGEGLRIIGADGTTRALARPSASAIASRRVATRRASFRSTRPAPARWTSASSSSQLSVALARAPLGLALERGAVEADVTKVKSGEAFVVDVGGTRVAVRGTHLRVARDGAHATVDLSEGTIAIGPVPASGMTEGALVKAPAHVEIDLAHGGTVTVDARVAAVRARTFDHDVRVTAAIATADQPPPDDSTAPSPSVAPPVPRPTTTAPLKPTTAADPRTPSTVVGDAVVACIEKHVPATSRHVTITSTLVLDIDGTSGAVKIARFEPPLPPEVQTCASETIYKTRFSGQTTLERIAIRAER
ncbi:MAG: FecR domain-containing protein [Polyangiaceae bacterium]